MKKIYLILFAVMVGFAPGDVIVQFRELAWNLNKRIEFGGKMHNILYFDGCQIPETGDSIPYYVECRHRQSCFHKTFRYEV
jgi:hypothetical protein